MFPLFAWARAHTLSPSIKMHPTFCAATAAIAVLIAGTDAKVMRTIISTSDAPAAIGPYSQAVKVRKLNGSAARCQTSFTERRAQRICTRFAITPTAPPIGATLAQTPSSFSASIHPHRSRQQTLQQSMPQARSALIHRPANWCPAVSWLRHGVP